MTSTGTLVFRADAGATIGIGHVMRCLTLALAWQEVGGKAVFLMATLEPKVVERLQKLGINVAQLKGSLDDADQTIALVQQVKAAWVVLDGYDFDSDYQKRLHIAGCRILCLDDLCKLEQFHADIILNQNIYAKADYYRHICGNAKLLIGLRYALLRPEFQMRSDWQRVIPPVARRVLVTLGGADQRNISLQVLYALQELEQRDLEVTILVGDLNPHRDELTHAAQAVRFSVDVREAGVEMPALMAWADIAFSAGGSTCWELASMGLPMLLTVVADNQRRICEELDAAGVAFNLGNWDELSHSKIVQVFLQLQSSPQKRASLSHQGRQLVDGDGCRRVLSCLLNHENSVATGASR